MYQFHGIDLTISLLCQASQAHIQFKHTHVLHILCAHVNILLFWYRIVNPESWITKEMVTLKQWYINDTPKLVYLTPKVTTALFMIVKMKRVEDPPQHPRRNGCKGDVSQVLPCAEFLGGKNAPESQTRCFDTQIQNKVPTWRRVGRSYHIQLAVATSSMGPMHHPGPVWKPPSGQRHSEPKSGLSFYSRYQSPPCDEWVCLDVWQTDDTAVCWMFGGPNIGCFNTY